MVDHQQSNIYFHSLKHEVLLECRLLKVWEIATFTWINFNTFVLYVINETFSLGGPRGKLSNPHKKSMVFEQAESFRLRRCNDFYVAAANS